MITKVICWLALFASLAVIFYFQGISNAYLIVGFAGLLISSILLLLNKEARINMFILLSSVIATLYILELFVGFVIHESFTPKEQRVNASKTLGIEYDMRERDDIYKESKKQITLTVSPSNFIDHSKSGLIPLSPSKSKSYVINCNESGTYATYMSDRFGFNNPDFVWDDNQVDWVVTGDSFINGSCVSEEDTLTYRLRLRNDSNSVLNVGANGNGPLLEYAALKEYAYQKKPNKVIWVYYEGNDMANLNNEMKDKTLIKYFQEGFTQNIKGNQAIVDNMIQQYILSELNDKNKQSSDFKKQLQWNTRYLRFYHLRNIIKKVILQSSASKKSTINPKMFKIISIVRDEIDRWGGELIFVYLPEHSRYSDISINHDTFNNKKDVLLGIESLGIKFIDIHDEMFSQKQNPNEFFPFGLFGHYTEDAYNKISEIISKKINNIK